MEPTRRVPPPPSPDDTLDDYTSWRYMTWEIEHQQHKERARWHAEQREWERVRTWRELALVAALLAGLAAATWAVCVRLLELRDTAIALAGHLITAIRSK